MMELNCHTIKHSSHAS